VHAEHQLLAVLEALDDLDLALVDQEKALGSGVLFDDELPGAAGALGRDLVDLVQVVLREPRKEGDLPQLVELGGGRIASFRWQRMPVMADGLAISALSSIECRQVPVQAAPGPGVAGRPSKAGRLRFVGPGSLRARPALRAPGTTRE